MNQSSMASATKNIIVRITNDTIWFNDTIFVNLAQTNLPIGDFRFVEGRSIFWEAEMVGFDREDACLTIRVINYRPEMIDAFLNQKPKSIVRSIKFIDIFWPAFSTDLSFYKKTSFLPLLTENMPKTSSQNEEKVVHIKAEIAFTKLRFGAGYVSFDYKFFWADEKMEIKIHNSSIIPEFDFVKSYFSKHFNRRTIDVLMVVTKAHNKTHKVVATSRQVEQIKDVAIETMKFVRMEKLKHPPKFIKEIDKSLFTPEDIFDPFDKNMLGSYKMTQQELFEHIMSWEDKRNKRQLEYLSGHLHEVKEKIRFTLTPKFGFLFVVHGDRMIHYIWEMLNTNATYIWSFDHGVWSKTKQIDKMEEVISFIRNHGRESYLRNVSPQEDILFRRVKHQGAGSQLVDYFPRWRHSINEAMV